MKNLFRKLSSVLIVLAIIFGAGLTGNLAVAALQFVQTPTITLYTSVAGSATSMRVTPYPRDLDGIKLTMTDFGTSPTATIDPKVRNTEEIVGFTGIVDNGDNTATLTGLTRDLTSKSPYTTPGSGRAHSASAIVVFSNNPQMYARFAAPENTQTWSAVQTFTSTTPPAYNVDPIWANFSTQIFADVAYVNSVVAAGAANASESVKGIIQLATGVQAALGTSAGSTGARLVLGNNLATSTPTFTGTNVIPVTGTNQKLSQLFFDLTQGFTWTGLHIFNTGGILDNASSTFNATTTQRCSNVNSNGCIYNGVTYAFPSTQGANNQSLVNNGSGVLSWSQSPAKQYSIASTSAVNLGQNGSVTSAPITIPAGVFTASSTAIVTGTFSCTDGGSGNTCVVSIIDSNSNDYIDFSISPGISRSCTATFIIRLISNNSTSAQIAVATGGCYVGGAAAWVDGSNANTTSVNWSNLTNLELRFTTANSTSASGILKNFISTVTP
jgi:hypothetical protein